MVAPRIQHLPEQADTKVADQAIAFCREVGLNLDEWQELVLHSSLVRNEAGRWPLEVGVNVARQNGKGELVLARLLVGAFILEQPLQIYSAHEFSTAMEHLLRLEWLLEEQPTLYDEVDTGRWGAKMISHSHGQEGVTFKGKRRIKFRTRTKGGGRGFSCETLIGDEAMVFSEMQHGALFPILSTRPDAQIWYLGSAVDQMTHDHGVVFARVRERGIKGEDPSLAYFEWSAGNGQPLKDNPDNVTEDTATDQAAWAQANPALGIRIDPSFVAKEQRAMSNRTFAVERLGVGDWPRTDYAGDSVISIEEWKALADPRSVLQDPIYVAFDVSPDRKTSLAAAGRNMQGKWHVEVFEAKKGTNWLPDRLREVISKHAPAEIVCDAFGPAGSLVRELDNLGIEVRTLTATEHGQACGRFLDVIERNDLRHLGSDELSQAIMGAKTRPLGDAWAWSRKHSSVDISPLVASTLALSAAIEDQARSVYDSRGMVAL